MGGENGTSNPPPHARLERPSASYWNTSSSTVSSHAERRGKSAASHENSPSSFSLYF